MSEADPFRKGVVMYLGRTVNDLCPVGVIAAYLVVRGRHPGPFFKVVIRVSSNISHGRIKETMDTNSWRWQVPLRLLAH